MAHADKKHFGPGAQSKGSGTGAMTNDPPIPENVVLSNRDKAQDSRGRGQDGKRIQAEQMHDSELNQHKL
jgi:hypothetical protein